MTDPRNRRLMTLLGILAVVAAMGLRVFFVGAPLTLMAIQQAREAARRRQVENNLKQIGLATHDDHGRLGHPLEPVEWLVVEPLRR